jgi:hypothetical protein
MFDLLPNYSVFFWIASTGVLTTTYPIVARTFPFRATVSRDYKAVNVIKGSTLAMMAPAGASLALISLADMQEDWVRNIWAAWLPVMSAVYAALDLSAVIYYRDCAQTTLVHHTLVQLFYLYLEWVQYEYSLAARAIVLYAGVSSCEFIVNVRLALRGSILGPAAIQLNRKTLRVYLVGTYVNFVGQGYLVWMAGSENGWAAFPVEYWIVALAMCGVFLDDLYLILYLWKWKPRVLSRSQRKKKAVSEYGVPSLAALASRSTKAE